MRYIEIEKEAGEYFSHNPKEKVIGFAMLDAEQIKQANNGDEIEGEIMILDVVVNPDVEEVIHNEYTGGN